MTGWNAVVLFSWLSVAAGMSDFFGGGGSIVAFLLLPLLWVVWVNLRERWASSDDQDGN